MPVARAEYHPTMPDLIIVLVVVLIIVIMLRGPKTLPEIGSMLGRGTKNLKDELEGKNTGDEGPRDQGPPS